MIQLAVTDANIFIDLIILGLEQHLFVLEIEVHTTREVFDQLTKPQKEVLQNSKLIIYDFSADEINAIYQLKFPAGLEPADRSVFYRANQLGCMVISGDNKLRKYCEKQGLEVDGLIWVFDEIVARGHISQALAVEKLNKLISYNDRLPMEEILKRIRKWK